MQWPQEPGPVHQGQQGRQGPVHQGRPGRRGRRQAFTMVLTVAVLVLGAFTWKVAQLPWGQGIGDGFTDVGEFLHLSDGPAISPLRAAIVAAAESQLGYSTEPPDSYCNKFSAYWYSGTDDCGSGLLDEEWCADFAAWAWQKGGAVVDYQYVNGDLNSSSASFYEWGVAHGTWHPAGSKYTPQPGDAAVYGLDAAALVAQHVAIVTSYAPGQRGPDVVNGDGDRTGFSVVETGTDQYEADVAGTTAHLSGYVSPTAPGPTAPSGSSG